MKLPMKMHLLLRFWIILCGTVLGVFTAQAESVVISSPYGDKAQGWLFAARSTNTCWLAMPSHLFKSGIPSTINFTNLQGQSGEAGPIILISEHPQALIATNGQDDLAFAPLTTAWKRKDCSSDLGLPTYSYMALLKNYPRLQLIDSVGVSSYTFEVEVNQVKSDIIRGLVISVWPTDATKAARMKPGISGAVATIKHTTGSRPFVMIFRVNQRRRQAIGLRFDAIRSAFVPIDRYWREQLRLRKTAKEGIDFQIVSYSALQLANSTGPNPINKPQGCWIAASSGGSATVDLIITNSSEFDKIEGLIVTASKECDTKYSQSFYLEYRALTEKDWIYLGKCQVNTIAEDEVEGCRIGLEGKHEFRLRFPTNGGKIGVSQLEFH